MTEQQGKPTALEVAKKVLENTDKEKYPKLYQAREQSVKALKIADLKTKAYEQQRDRAALAETKAKKKFGKKGESKTPKNKEGFDYGELAFLEAKGILEHCHDYLLQEVQSTGKELKELLKFDYIKEEMKRINDQKASEEAIPEGSKRGGKSTKDSVDYWLAKGEMPPADQPELRREYVNRKIKQETEGSKFTDTPVVGQ